MVTINIWKNQKEVEKVLKCEQYDLMLGTLEDVLKLFRLGDIENEIQKLDEQSILQIIVKEYDKITVLLHDVFPDMTIDDRKKIKVRELIPFFMQLIAYAVGQITSIETRKN